MFQRVEWNVGLLHRDQIFELFEFLFANPLYSHQIVCCFEVSIFRSELKDLLCKRRTDPGKPFQVRLTCRIDVYKRLAGFLLIRRLRWKRRVEREQKHHDQQKTLCCQFHSFPPLELSFALSLEQVECQLVFRLDGYPALVWAKESKDIVSDKAVR